MKLVLVSTQTAICFSNIKRSGLSQNVFTLCGGDHLMKDKGLMPLLESMSS